MIGCKPEAALSNHDWSSHLDAEPQLTSLLADHSAAQTASESCRERHFENPGSSFCVRFTHTQTHAPLTYTFINGCLRHDDLKKNKQAVTLPGRIMDIEYIISLCADVGLCKHPVGKYVILHSW